MGERVLAILLVASTVACEDTFVIDTPLFSGDLFRVLPAGPVVVSTGDSRRLSVRLAEEAELPPGKDYSDFLRQCPLMLPELFRWSIRDQNMAQVEPYAGVVVTITGLAVGETEIHVQYSTYDWLYRSVWLTVVAPSGDAHGASPNLAEPDSGQR